MGGTRIAMEGRAKAAKGNAPAGTRRITSNGHSTTILTFAERPTRHAFVDRFILAQTGGVLRRPALSPVSITHSYHGVSYQTRRLAGYTPLPKHGMTNPALVALGHSRTTGLLPRGIIEVLGEEKVYSGPGEVGEVFVRRAGSYRKNCMDGCV